MMYYDVKVSHAGQSHSLDLVYNMMESERTMREWLDMHVVSGEYVLVAYDADRVVELTESMLLYYWVDLVRFKNTSDLVAFKLRFGI